MKTLFYIRTWYFHVVIIGVLRQRQYLSKTLLCPTERLVLSNAWGRHHLTSTSTLVKAHLNPATATSLWHHSQINSMHSGLYCYTLQKWCHCDVTPKWLCNPFGSDIADASLSLDVNKLLRATIVKLRVYSQVPLISLFQSAVRLIFITYFDITCKQHHRNVLKHF